MGLFTRDIKSMDDLFVHTLRDMYYAEKQISKSLPKMIEKADDEELKQGLEDHLKETDGHIRNLEEVFHLLDIKPGGVDCPAIDGIIQEADDVTGEVDNRQVVDAALVAAAQAVEHYEITRYGTLITWAQQLGRNDCAELLKHNLKEEKAADEKLTKLAESRVNQAAI
jgi:ferritin-like metal-binding protein YciE